MIISESNRVGDISELKLVTHYWEKGYEVFRNLGSTGLIDIIVVCPKTKEILLLDVKTPTIRVDSDNITTIYSNHTSEKQRILGVEVVALHNGKVYTDPIRVKERYKNES
jgi:hypothetical protein